jgi:hemerythrin-like metal-binding protein
MPNRRPRLEWGPQFRTGIKVQDEQHQVLFDLINLVDDQLLQDTPDETLLHQAIDGVVAYTLYHFVTEESLAYRLQATDGIDAHLKQHNEFRKALGTMQQNARQADDGKLIKLAGELLRFLQNWLTSHIMATDFALAREIKRKAPREVKTAGKAEGLRIIVTEDNRDLREEIVFFLSHIGHHVDGAGSGKELDNLMATNGADVIILDLGLPDIDGIELLDRYGGRTDLAVVVMTARNTTKDRIEGYRHGADAYLTKPVDMRELVAVIDRAVQRLYSEPVDDPHAWAFSESLRTLTPPGGTPIELTELQVRLMGLFLPGRQTLQRTLIAEALNNKGFESEGSLDERIEASISRLRRRIEENGNTPSPIKTVRGVGYQFGAHLIRKD